MLRIFSCAYWPSMYFLWRNVYLDLLRIFWLGCLVFLLSCTSCLYILEIKPLLVALFASIFSQSVECLFILIMVSKILLIFNEVQVINLVFYRPHLLLQYLWNYCLTPNCKEFLPKGLYFSVLNLCLWSILS